MAKASDNIFPLLRLAPGAAPASPASGSVALFVDNADGSVKTKDAAGVVKAVGGSGGSRDLRWYVPAGCISIDEFNDDTLDPAWVRVDPGSAPAGNVTWTEKGDALSAAQAGGDSSTAVHGLMRPLSPFGGSVAPGDAFVTAIRLFGPQSNFTMGGILLSDGTASGSGNQVLANSYITGAGTALTFNAWAANGWLMGGQTTDGAFVGPELFLRLVCVTASTWRCDASPDGISWLLGPSTTSKAFTPTHVGLMNSSWGTSTKGIVKYEFLRRVSGIS